jgi:glycosyltransferase involved in cell wall biosynthesis
MIRVLWLTDWQPAAVRRRLALPNFPGPQAWVDALAELLSRRHDVELAVAAPGPQAFEPFEEDGVLYLHLPRAVDPSRVARIIVGWQHRPTSAETLAAAQALVRARRPDLVHIHGTESAFGLLAQSMAPTPCVISLQGILQAYERLYFAGRSPREVAGLMANSEFLKGRGVVHRYILLRRQARREACIMRRARWFIGRTAWDRQALAAVNPAASYFHCDEIMRPEFYETQWVQEGHDGATIYSTSSAMLGKGTECLLGAFALLQSRPLRGLRLRVAGVEPGSEVDGLYRGAARRLGVEHSVEWLGRLDATGIAGELQAADVFAYPSHVDNSPNALVEAMLVGTPAVATRVGGIPTLLEEGKQGLLVPRGDSVALADAVLRLLTDRALARRLGAAARATALRRNEPARLVARTMDIYADVIAQAKAGAPVYPAGTSAAMLAQGDRPQRAGRLSVCRGSLPVMRVI